MACLDDLRTEIPGDECIGASRSRINTNFTNIGTAVCALSSDVDTLKADVANLQTDLDSLSGTVNTLLYPTSVAYKESTFVYSAAKNTAGMVGQWQDVFINPSRDPLRLSVTNGSSRTLPLLIEAKLHLRYIDWWSSNWARLGLFGGESRTTYASPLSVLDVATSEGFVSYSHAHSIIMQTTQFIEPAKTLTYGMQTYFYSGGGNKGAVEVNGWHGDGGSGNNNQGGPRNIVSTSGTYVGIYAIGASSIYPGQVNVGIGNGNTAFGDPTIKNISYIRITALG